MRHLVRFVEDCAQRLCRFVLRLGCIRSGFRCVKCSVNLKIIVYLWGIQQANNTWGGVKRILILLIHLPLEIPKYIQKKLNLQFIFSSENHSF